MRKIIFGILIIVTASLIAIGTSNSFLADTGKSNANNFSAGILDIVDGASTLVPFNFSGLAPGNIVSKTVSLRNAGTVPIGTLVVSVTNKTGDAGLIDQINISPELNGSNILGSDVISPGETYTVVFNFSVPTTLGQEWQGKSMSFDLEFFGEQTN